jgi:hypothetical protein
LSPRRPSPFLPASGFRGGGKHRHGELFIKAKEVLDPFVAAMACVIERVMERADEFGCLNICKVLVAENSPLLVDDETEILKVTRQVLDRGRSGAI